MDADPLSMLRFAWDGDMHEPPLGKELPECGGAGVTEDGVRAAGEHRCHPSAFLAEAPVADGVHSAMKAVQALGLSARSTPAIMDTRAFELRKGDHAVLVRRKPGNDGVRIVVGEFPSHGGR
jgi:hypothetical protein